MPHFDEALTKLLDRATDSFGMGRFFECLMQAALPREPGIREFLLMSPFLWPSRAREGRSRLHSAAGE